MKTLKELYGEIMASYELKKEYFAAANDGKTAEFLKSHGCGATLDELNAFLSNPKELPQGEVCDDELDSVAGGTCYKDGRPVVTVLNGCDYWTCDNCGIAPTVHYSRNTSYGQECYDKCTLCGALAVCAGCRYCHYEDALWQCYNPKRKNN